MNSLIVENRRYYMVVDRGRILFRSHDRAAAGAYCRGWNSPTAAILKVQPARGTETAARRLHRRKPIKGTYVNQPVHA
jgi:hypothetical protein